MQALLVTLTELLFNYKRSADREELGLLGSQGKEASQIDEIGQRSSQGVWVQLRYLSVTPP
jgi:hypothetical protein